MTPLIGVLSLTLVGVGMTGILVSGLPWTPLVFGGLLMAAWADRFQTEGQDVDFRPIDTSFVSARSSSMKLSKAALITLGLLLCWVVNGYADRLYTWTDAKGVTHITQDPPPETAKAVDTIDYSSQPNQPVRRSTASDRPNQQQGNPNQGDGQHGSGVSTGTSSGNADDNIEYDYTGGPYRRTLRQYERRGDLLDINEPGRVGDLPERIQPRPRRR